MELIIGWLLGFLISLAVNEGLLFLVWDGNGPGWYVYPVIVSSVFFTFTGVYVGLRYY